MSSGTIFGLVTEPRLFVLAAWQFLPVYVCSRVQNIGSFSVFRRVLLGFSHESHQARRCEFTKKTLTRKSTRIYFPPRVSVPQRFGFY